MDEDNRMRLEQEVKRLPIQQIDTELGYQTETSQAEENRVESLGRGQAEIEKAQSELQREQSQASSPQQQAAFDLLDQVKAGKISPRQYAEMFQQQTGVKVPGGDAEANKQRDQQLDMARQQREHASELRRRYGRDVSSEYIKSIKRAKESGMYQDDFKDNLFGAGAFNGMKGKSRRGWTKDDYKLELSQLNDEVEDFEKTRQQLTENFQRLDPFARTQYNEMSKRIQGLEKARANGQVRPIEYLRAMGTLADQAQQVKWKYHMRQPGQSPGEISEQNGMMMQMTQEGPKTIGLTPDYIKKNTYIDEAGNRMVPKLGKDGIITHEEMQDKNRDNIPDSMQMNDLRKEYEDKVKENFESRQKAWQESNPLEEPKDSDYDKWMNEARTWVANQDQLSQAAVEARFDPQKKEAFQQHVDSRRQTIDEQQQQEMQQEVNQMGEMERQQIDEQDAQVVEAATEQLMEKHGFDENKARQVALDDVYVQKTADPMSLLKARNSYDLEAKRAERGIDANQMLSYNARIKKAKNRKEKEKIRSENWERDPILSWAADNPVVYQPGMKRKAGEVYIMRKGSEYVRVWHLGEGRNIVLKTPEEKLGERMQRIEESEGNAKRDAGRKRLREAEKAASQYQGRF
jgi:hypothetical protein